jgi:CubicO group peptidase (beta-lactamase class C family)
MTTTTIAPADLATAVQAELARQHVPGAAVGLLRDGTVETWGFGVASIETGFPVRADTLFQFGSISKVFTATLILQLVEQGRLDLDTPVVRYLPSLRLADAEATGSVTLRQLLTHTAGFYGDRFNDYGPGPDALTKAIAEFHSLRQYTPPGARWAYSNTGFQLAGAVAQEVMGQEFESLMRERVMEPLGITRTFYFADEAITYPIAVGHNTLPEQEIELTRTWARHRARAPQGGLTGTVGDLLRFASFHMGMMPDSVGVLGEAGVREMQRPQVTAGSFAEHYGFGWALRRFGDTLVVGHGGSTNGFRAQLSLVPQQRLAVAVLTNGNNGSRVAERVEAWALDTYAGLRRVLPETVELPVERMTRLEGRYERPDNDIEVRVAGSRLRIQVSTINVFTGEPSPAPPMHAAPLSDLSFLGLDGDAEGETIDFFLDGSGTPEFMRLHGRLAERIAGGG